MADCFAKHSFVILRSGFHTFIVSTLILHTKVFLKGSAKYKICALISKAFDYATLLLLNPGLLLYKKLIENSYTHMYNLSFIKIS